MARSQNTGSRRGSFGGHKGALTGPCHGLFIQASSGRMMANVMCINVKVFDAIAAHGRGVTLEQAHDLLPTIPPSSVTSAAHRLSSNGALTLRVGRQAAASKRQ